MASLGKEEMQTESRAALGVVVCLFGFEILEGRDVQVAEVRPRCVYERHSDLLPKQQHKG